MDHRKRNIRLGVLMVLALIAAVGGIGMLVWNKIQDPKDIYFVLYRDSVSGLEVGTTVRMKGVNVGQIFKIDIAEHSEGVLVTLALKPGTPISVDTRATLTPLGITGLKFIELSGGSARSTPIMPNTRRSIIRPGDSVLRQMMKHAQNIVGKTDQLRGNLAGLTARVRAGRAAKLKHNTEALFATLGRVQQSNRQRMRRISHRIDRVTRAMERASRALGRLRESVDQQLPETRRSALAAVRALERAVSELKLEQTEEAVEQAVRAAKRRGATLNLDSTAAIFSAASQRLGRVSDELASSIKRTDTKWSEVKKNLREAGLFIEQLKRRYAK